MITEGITEIYLAPTNGHVTFGADALALLEDDTHYPVGVVVEPPTGYAGWGKVFVHAGVGTCTDGFIPYLDNYALWQNVVEWAYYCPGDFNRDTVRDFTDFSVFLLAYDSYQGDENFFPQCDMDDSGHIDFTDFTAFGVVYLVPCP